MHDGARIGRLRAVRPCPAPTACRLRRRGPVARPARGADLVVRAAPSPSWSCPARAPAVCQSFKPLHDALAAAGLRGDRARRGAAAPAMVVVTLGRSRAEALGDAAARLTLLPPGGRLPSTAPGPTDRQPRPQVARVLPLEGASPRPMARSSGTRPETLPPRSRAGPPRPRPGPTPRASSPRPACSPPTPPTPAASASPRRSRASSPAVSPTSAPAGAGSRSGAGGQPRPRRHRPLRGRGPRAGRRPVNLPDPRASFHWTDVPASARVPPL